MLEALVLRLEQRGLEGRNGQRTLSWDNYRPEAVFWDHMPLLGLGLWPLSNGMGT